MSAKGLKPMTSLSHSLEVLQFYFLSLHEVKHIHFTYHLATEDWLENMYNALWFSYVPSAVYEKQFSMVIFHL